MAAEKDVMRGMACSVEFAPDEVDAGGELTLGCKVSCDPTADLRGQTLLIKDQDDASIGCAKLTEFDGDASETGDFVVKAPIEPGAYTWLAVFPADEKETGSPVGTSIPFSFAVKPHSLRILVWDAPTAIELGGKFTIKLGVKCSSECSPHGWTVEVRDHDNEVCAEVTLSEEPRPGTTALYYAEVDLRAPANEGRYAWEAKALAHDSDIAHAESVAGFGVRVVPEPECVLTVLAIDRESRAPVEGATVAVYPYTTLTDECGVAEVNIPKGKYRLFVSGKNYFPFRSDGVAKTEAVIEAELVLDSGLTDEDLWS